MTSRRQNKFADLISAVRDGEETPVVDAPAVPPQIVTEPTPQEKAGIDPPHRGRPLTGKRSNPDFEQVTAYIRRDTNIQIKIALLQEGNTRDFSDLVEDLLQAWLLNRQ
ncbi:hypothetical protein K2Z83_19460 [Oscillochloris sp. ZM17-4]|uniref:hypothetical protein n=1 Tax=Oscillochloris sp. ZM17-4 TaxID=2866714 RepID=UPI001C7326EA|nr:hypothetical protein [Oscillochloris sp. ZM17-4]MBX0329846.1 hypothetical protein [Oscillochloris sp. ZM17-4]